MEIQASSSIVRCASFISAIFLSVLLSTKVHAQTLDVVSTGPNTFTMTVSNVYNWFVDEKINGTWNLILEGGASGITGVPFTRKAGTYTFRLRNCYNMGPNPCSTSNDRNVRLLGGAPAAPTISTSSTHTSITVTWTQPAGTASFIFTRNGTPVVVSGTSFYDTAATGGVTYTYTVTGCNTYGDCSTVASASAALAINPATQSKTIQYKYDELGRLTFVTDPANGNRDYDYDNAGNRVLVTTHTVGDGASEPGPTILPAPTNLNYSLIASCAWSATWNPVSGASKYRVADTSGGVQFVTTTQAVIQCPVGNSSGNKPRKVQACTFNDICGTEAYFNQ